jgi:hypothetical protein
MDFTEFLKSYAYLIDKNHPGRWTIIIDEVELEKMLSDLYSIAYKDGNDSK